MKYSYTNSHKSKDHGKNYDKRIYTGNTYDNRVWILEKKILKKILPSDKKLAILDFACGTGRISSYLEELGYQNISGIDVSDSMLQEAKKKLKVTQLIKADVNDLLGVKKIKKKFDVII